MIQMCEDKLFEISILFHNIYLLPNARLAVIRSPLSTTAWDWLMKALATLPVQLGHTTEHKQEKSEGCYVMKMPVSAKCISLLRTPASIKNNLIPQR